MGDLLGDTLIDGVSSHTLLGGRGADVFQITAGGGRTTIHGSDDFDTLQITGFSVANADAFRNAISETADGLRYGGEEHTLLMAGMTATNVADLTVLA